MTAIHKFKVEPGPFTLDLPRHSRVLTVQTQRGEPYIWVLCSPNQPKKTKHFWCLGTGHDAAGVEGWHYVGTFQFEADGLVFHLFEKPARMYES